jgi:hypothetical protein
MKQLVTSVIGRSREKILFPENLADVDDEPTTMAKFCCAAKDTCQEV